MVTKHNLDCFDAFTARFIRGKVRQLIGRAGFKESDRPDLLQEFAIDLIQRRAHFDPEAANWEAFVVVVCENRCATILEHHQAEMRSHEREGGSLNSPTKAPEGKRTDDGATIPESQQGLRTGQYHRPHEDVSGLAQDVAHVLKQLPPRLRELCDRLKQDSVSDVARETGVSRTELYRRIDRIRQRFEEAGIRGYL